MQIDNQAFKLPELVKTATKLAEEAGFTHSSSPAVGRLLAVLTAQCQFGPIAEIGTGYGVGAAWILSKLAPSVGFITVELDKQRAEAVKALFRSFSNLTVLNDDWQSLVQYGPFELIFADGGKAKQNSPTLLIDMLKPGGTLVLDDFTPEYAWTAEQRAVWANDPLRPIG